MTKANPDPLLCRRLCIDGRVQGVGYRWSLRAHATALGLRGWVRNRRDGSVEALLCGPPEAVEKLTVWAHSVPPDAHVKHVISRDLAPAEADLVGPGFEQLPTI